MPRRRNQEGLTDDEVFSLAATYENVVERAGALIQEKKTISESICSELERRGSASLVSDDGLVVTRAQAENVVIDEKALYGDLRPAMRRKVYRPSVQIASLPDEDQKALLMFLKDRGLMKKVNWFLDANALSSAVQAGKIDGELVAAHTEVVKNAPYVRVSHRTER